MKRFLALLSFLLISSIAVAQTRGLPDFTDLVDKVGPAVVNIRTTERAKQMQQGGPGAEDEEMQEFFRRFEAILTFARHCLEQDIFQPAGNFRAPARRAGRLAEFRLLEGFDLA